jgi:hypothetical protein
VRSTCVYLKFLRTQLTRSRSRRAAFLPGAWWLWLFLHKMRSVRVHLAATFYATTLLLLCYSWGGEKVAVTLGRFAWELYLNENGEKHRNQAGEILMNFLKKMTLAGLVAGVTERVMVGS